MKRIKDKSVNEIVVEKSRFITYLLPIENESDATLLIKEYSKKYADATHVVYAFRLNNTERSNDDGEPKGTAGIPTLEVLRRENIINTIAITIRYFGGIKLGASGLLRTYIDSVTEAIKKSIFLEETEVVSLTLVLSYKDSSYFDSHFNEYLKCNKTFSDNVSYNLLIKKENINIFNDIVALFNGKAIIKDLKEDRLFL